MINARSNPGRANEKTPKANRRLFRENWINVFLGSANGRMLQKLVGRLGRWASIGYWMLGYGSVAFDLSKMRRIRLPAYHLLYSFALL
jgi:hypothetical protein